MIYNFPNTPDWCEKSVIVRGEIQCLKCRGSMFFLLIFSRI